MEIFNTLINNHWEIAVVLDELNTFRHAVFGK